MNGYLDMIPDFARHVDTPRFSPGIYFSKSEFRGSVDYINALNPLSGQLWVGF